LVFVEIAGAPRLLALSFNFCLPTGGKKARKSECEAAAPENRLKN
jgi:hypothetical protein